MNKNIIIFVIIIAIFGMFCYIYSQNKITKNQQIIYKNEYKNLKNEEISGTEFASIINKAIDRNTLNNVPKDNNGLFIDEGENSIIIEVKFVDDENIINVQKIFNNDITKFISIYGKFKFKCTKIEIFVLWRS